MSPFITFQIGSILLGSTALFWFTKRRTGYLKKNEAFWMLVSLLFIVLCLPDFQLSFARSFKFMLLASLITLAILLVAYLLHHEKTTDGENLQREINPIVNHFLYENKSRINVKKDYILVLMPAYNEASHLKKVLELAPQTIFGLTVVLLVIDDGSIDQTSQIAQRLCYVISLPKNRGGGYALLTGFNAAKKLGAPYIVTMDADGQHRFSDMKNLIKPILKQKADIVLGNRFKENSIYSNKCRSAGILLFNQILKIFLGYSFSDCSNSYRAFTLESLRSLDLREERHHTAEFLIRVVRREMKIVEVPVHVGNRLSGKSKKGNNILYALRFARTILTSWWRS